MVHIFLVYHSGFGHTKVVAEKIKKGMESIEDVKAVLLTADEAKESIDDLDAADAIVFGCPTYMGSPSAEMKSFIDKTSDKWMKHAWKNKIAAGFTNSGSLSGSKSSTLYDLFTLAMQHGMIWVGQGEPAPMKQSGHGGQPEDVNRVGGFVGLMTQSDNTEPEKTPSSGDKKTAELFGRRIAEMTKRWTKSAVSGADQ